MSNALSASAKGVTFLILTQVGSRALTFVINQLLLRYLSPELLGAATQLELYLISIQYFARESLRVALQRQTGNSQAVVNVSYISVTAGLPLAYLLARLYKGSSLPNVQYIEQSLALYGLAAMLELLAEPCFVIVQQKMAYKVRAAAETMATIGRCVVTFAAVFWAARTGRDLGVLPFALGQMAYSLLLLAIYYARTLRIATQEKFSLLPKRITPKCVTVNACPI
jgi:oligosaccharide translocation protein RFT1